MTLLSMTFCLGKHYTVVTLPHNSFAVSSCNTSAWRNPSHVGLSRAARILVAVYPLFLQLACLNSISFRQNPFKLSGVSDSSKIAREPTPFGQENSHSRDM